MPLPHFGSSYIPTNINKSSFKINIISSEMPYMNCKYFSDYICCINKDTIEIALCTYQNRLSPLIIISNFDNKKFDIEIEIQNNEKLNIGILTLHDCKIKYDFSQFLDFNSSYEEETSDSVGTFVVNYTYSNITYRANDK